MSTMIDFILKIKIKIIKSFIYLVKIQQYFGTQNKVK